MSGESHLMTGGFENGKTPASPVALVTGAASGLGAAIALRLVDAGIRVVASDIDAANGVALEEKLGCRFVPHDVSCEADWANVMDIVRQHYGRLDILVNNAGITLVGSIEDLDLAALRRSLDVDLVSVFLGCKAAIPLMKASAGGAIVNISSVAGLRAASNLVAYNAAKAGMTLMSKSIALHCAKQGYGIRCNTVHPGVIRTDMLDKVMSQMSDPSKVMASFVALHPLGHIGEPDDVAEMVLFLATAASKFVTGAEFVVDGGRLL
jgi:NAD(P)-dependent dehydrogenase (short-subunit alcohol dehydrogenase family)